MQRGWYCQDTLLWKFSQKYFLCEAGEVAASVCTPATVMSSSTSCTQQALPVVVAVPPPVVPAAPPPVVPAIPSCSASFPSLVVPTAPLL